MTEKSMLTTFSPGDDEPELISPFTSISFLRSVLNEGLRNAREGEVDGNENGNIVLSETQYDILRPLVMDIENEVKSLKAKLETVSTSRKDIFDFVESLIKHPSESERKIGHLAVYWIEYRNDIEDQEET
jgi:hypothetical protein